MGSCILSVEDICKSFDDHDGRKQKVLEGVSFELQAGTITSLLGASGCGKTSLLKILAGLERADSGIVRTDIRRPGPKVGYVQQGERLLPWRSLVGNVGLGLELLGEAGEKGRQLALEALDQVGLREFAMRHPAHISGGMTQRVLLARAFLTQPMLLLLDEPLGQLDILARKQLAEIVRGYVRSSGAAALLVTHSVEEAVFISDVVLTVTPRPARVLDRFQVVEEGQPLSERVVQRGDCFGVIQRALLNTLGEKVCG
jgi:ABC-type nitrate/sulfonate/bicarbonate transport system ATPase subunit